MKKTTLTLTLFSLSLCIGITLFLHQKRNGETEVSLKDTPTRLTFTASFHQRLMPQVTRYMDSCGSILRKEKANFRIQSSEGELNITADKQLNSSITMTRIKRMCQDIGRVII
jgi:hypothetical protein